MPPLHDILRTVNIKYEYYDKKDILFSQFYRKSDIVFSQYYHNRYYCYVELVHCSLVDIEQ